MKSTPAWRRFPRSSPAAASGFLGFGAGLAVVGAVAVVLPGCETGMADLGLQADAAREVAPGDFVAQGSPTVIRTDEVSTRGDDAQAPQGLSREVVMVQPGGAKAQTDVGSGPIDEPVVEAVAHSIEAEAQPDRSQVRVELSDSTSPLGPDGAVTTAYTPGRASAGPLPIDGMIGQINGQPVFADDILGDLEPALRALGQRESVAGFRTRARKEIDDAIRSQLVNALILGEAERALTENEWNGVRFMRNRKRQELLRQHGQGSIAVAERNLVALTGRTLGETLERYQDGLITDSYVRRNLSTRVNVSRRDIERFFRDHPEQFNSPTVRDLVLIVCDDESLAQATLDQLNSGVPYVDVAAGPLNQLEGGGALNGISGDAPFGRPAVEAAMADLSPQSWAGPVDVGDGKFWFVWVESLEQGREMSLVDAQPVIERALQEQQFNQLSDKFKQRLLTEGSYESPARMVDALLEISVSRYAAR